jgi:hypothetical protein|tara:strand:- start:1122 stop:1517 length:396 start_codon:yes stop_codon:yes gene_type:complete
MTGDVDTEVAEMPDGTIDFDQPLLDMNDKPMKGGTAGDGDEEEDLRLGNVCVNALMAMAQDDKADGVQKLKRFNLARKIKGKDEDSFASVRLNSKQKKMVYDQVDQVFGGALIYARVYEALEGTTDEDDDE